MDSGVPAASCDLFTFETAIFRKLLPNLRTERHKSNCYLPGLQKQLLASRKHETFGGLLQLRATAESESTHTHTHTLYI